MDSRFITTKQLQKVSRLDKKAIKTSKETEDEQYYVTSCDLWPDERLLVERIFQESKTSEEIEVKILDLPKLHNPNEKVAQDFALSLSEVEDKSIFSYISVRSIVNYRWPLAREFVRNSQLLLWRIPVVFSVCRQSR